MILYKDLDAVKRTANNFLKSPFVSKLPVVNRYKELFAFTLAEILITLLIIGVVASLTIPNLIADTQEQELKVAWKKEYSILDQAMKLVLLDNGGNIQNFIDQHGDSIFPQLMTKLQYTKYGTLSNPILSATTNPSFNYKYLNGYVAGEGAFDDEQLILNDGAFIMANCVDCNSLSGQIIWIDVNGYVKGPNVIGKDVYGIKIYSNGIKPLGVQGDSYEETCSITKSGWGCGTVYLYQ